MNPFIMTLIILYFFPIGILISGSNIFKPPDKTEIRIENQANPSSSIFNETSWKIFIEKQDKKNRFLNFKKNELKLTFKRSLSIKIQEDFQNYEFVKKRSLPPVKFNVINIEEIMDQISSLRHQSYRVTQNPVRFDFIPTQEQIQIMNMVYHQDSITQIDLYAQLNQSTWITQNEFSQQLELLVKKGFLTKKKVSPDLIFILFFIPIEMSQQNLKNQLFQYKPNIQKEKLFNYLQSKLFFLTERSHQSVNDSTQLISKIDELQQSIYQLYHLPEESH